MTFERKGRNAALSVIILSAMNCTSLSMHTCLRSNVNSWSITPCDAVEFVEFVVVVMPPAEAEVDPLPKSADDDEVDVEPAELCLLTSICTWMVHS